MLSGLLNIGNTALSASQAWISVTGSNIANADTEGYTRRYVDQRDAGTLQTKPGGEGTGVNAQQVLRMFDAFLEGSYVRQSTNSSRWNEQSTIMTTVENIFNESNRVGISSALNNFFNAWQDLAQRPDDTASRESLLAYADTLNDLFGSTIKSIHAIQDQMDVSIRQGVERVNDIAKSIADLNRQITYTTIDGISNPNDLLDKRDQLVRELATYVDVEANDHGKGDFTVKLSTGQPLVNGTDYYSLDFLAAQSETHPISRKQNEAGPGEAYFDGVDTHEYTLEIVAPEDGSAISTPGAYGASGNPLFRVSLDGGKTWLRDEDGNELHYEISNSSSTDGDTAADGTYTDRSDKVLVKNLTIDFAISKDGENYDFRVGDQFTIIPKTGLYWIEPTHGPQNITPQVRFDGTDNPDRVTGGKLAAYFNVRDDNCGRYLDELDATASALIWEVNRIHSQGAGNILMDYAQGQQTVKSIDKPLGSPQAILPDWNRLQAGNTNFYFYDKTTGAYLDAGMLDFDSSSSGIQNFDPSTHTLKDVMDAINGIRIENASGTVIQPITAIIQDGKLILEADANVQFAFGTDSTGLMAALGLNSFFTGSRAADLAVNDQLHSNVNYVAAAQVDPQQDRYFKEMVNRGDNTNALALGKLSDTTVRISTVWKTVSNQTISQYYANQVTTVGADARLANTNAEYHTALTNDLSDQVDAVSGVNLDEEMSNLIKYQHSYTAAAKLITTADQMLQTVLGLKQ